ncbi:MAG: hypothetical protein KKH68_14170 [Proteobacteria bacterium]|nr:hypothetical protein [Pseudomonadota bacterium]
MAGIGNNPEMNLLKDTTALMHRVMRVLFENSFHENQFSDGISDSPGTSAVLFLIGRRKETKEFSPEPCLILNKRSIKIKQPGDLCYPGGSITARLDTKLAALLYLPGSPLTRWPYWPHWRKQRRREARRLAVLFAAGLRESYEEMRLNPFKVKLLGPLPPQRLVMFDRVIFPLVCQVSGHQRFTPNWEVEKVVYIPLKNLLNPANYARYRLKINIPPESGKKPEKREWLCFQHVHRDESEILWGATFRVTMVFLEMVFGFKPPEIRALPVIHGTLNANYLTGNT